MQSLYFSRNTTLLTLTMFVMFACARAKDEAPGTTGQGQGSGGTGPRPTNTISSTMSSATNASGTTSASGGTAGSGGAGVGNTGGAAGESSTGSGGSGGSGGVPQDVIDDADIVLLYKVGESNASSASIFAHLYLRNQSDSAFPLGAAEVRYWFDADGLTHAQVSHYQGPAVGSVTLTPASDADQAYIGITFEDAASLPANTSDINSTEFQLKVDASGGAFDQSNDFSFAPQFTTPTEHDKVTVYLAGRLVWGCEPSGTCASDTGGGGAAGAGGAAGGAGAPFD